MSDIRWTPRALRAATHLTANQLAELDRTLGYLRENPEMGVLLGEGRYRGYRRLFVRPHRHVYYRVIGQDRVCYLGDIRDARRRPV